MKAIYKIFFSAPLLFVSTMLLGQVVRRGIGFAEDFHNLPYFKTGIQTYQYSSTDPAEDQFNDYTHWLYSTKDSGAVLADIKGPGAIFRIWSTGNSGDSNRLKIYIDGKKAPAIDETFNDFHDHPPLRDRPQVGSGGDKFLAWWSYMPIAFHDSLKIVREGQFRPFYNITYHTYTDTTTVRSWTGKENYSKLENMWNHPDAESIPVAGDIRKKTRIKMIPGQVATVFNYTGSGYIAGIKINSYLAEKKFILKIFWDNETKPSVEAPVKWFFGSVDNGGDVRALGVGTINSNGYCYFPMPFWKNARIELWNLTDTLTRNMDIEILYNTHAYPELLTGYFHATANEAEKPGGKYTCLQTTGRGHVIGMAKRMPKGGHACEGDEIFYIDNRKFPDIYGTGEEDYSNCAWWKNSYNSYPTHGAIGNDCYYRMHYPDMLVYEEAIDMEFEAWQNYYIASVVWYYGKDKPSLVATDSLDVMNQVSEKKHGYQIEGEVWAGEKTGSYPGKRISTDTVTDDGRSVEKYSAFTVKTNPANKGVRLRIRTDHVNQQGVRVFVNGRLVTERPWVILKNNFDALWIDADFEIPIRYTKEKSKLNIRLEKLNGYNNWTAYRYTAYSYVY
ncbi:MAG: DUF2961 domain-containing protein [Bacteroidota bacterium]